MKILIAVPTVNSIHAETFKSIYDLEIPEGYTTDFKIFSSEDDIDTLRNKIAQTVVDGYDYLFAVDHDVVFERDTLRKMLNRNASMISGVYRQRLPEQNIEIYDLGLRRMFASELAGGVQEIGACGFGCVLVKKHVFVDVGYPYFVYKEALDHRHTFSEDLDFCVKARTKGHRIFVDSSIVCKHLGTTEYIVEGIGVQTEDPVRARLRQLGSMDLLPATHRNYLHQLKTQIQPKVIYDIGACVLHWTRHAADVWPDAKIVAFEAMKDTEFLYQEQGMPYVSGAALYHTDQVVLNFFENVTHPGGNSIYRENPALSPDAVHLFPTEKAVKRVGMRLDTLVDMYKFPPPDVIKIDVQGAELDVLKGADRALESCKDVIIELQFDEYNIGAAGYNTVAEYLRSKGFEQVGDAFSRTKYDADFHFRKRQYSPPSISDVQ